MAPAAGTASERDAVIVVTGEEMEEEGTEEQIPTEETGGAFIR